MMKLRFPANFRLTHCDGFTKPL